MDTHLTVALAQAVMRRHGLSRVVDGLELRRGGNISTVYEVRCTAPDPPVILKIYPDAFHWKMEKDYAIRTDEAKREGFLAGYGRLPSSWRERVRLYRLYHALELWDWFAAIGNTAPLVHLTDDLRRFAAV